MLVYVPAGWLVGWFYNMSLLIALFYDEISWTIMVSNYKYVRYKNVSFILNM